MKNKFLKIIEKVLYKIKDILGILYFGYVYSVFSDNVYGENCTTTQYIRLLTIPALFVFFVYVMYWLVKKYNKKSTIHTS